MKAGWVKQHLQAFQDVVVNHDLVGSDLAVPGPVDALEVLVDGKEAGLVLPVVRPRHLVRPVRVGDRLHRA